MTEPRKNAGNTRGKPFAKGNPGRPKGARNKTTLAVEAMLEADAERLAGAAIAKALEGDTVAMRLCLERIAPARKDSPVNFDLPKIETAEDALKAAGSVMRAVASGTITPLEGSAVMSLVESYRKTLELVELTSRIEALESRT